MIQPYPLAWPEGLPRSTSTATSSFKTGLPAALSNVRKALELFGRDTDKAVTNIVLSSNVALGADKPKDPGVAAWFDWDGAQRCIAVDRYPKTEENLQAIYHVIEARRTEMRHGGLHIVRQTFKGFTALAAPKREKASHWWEILEVATTASDAEITAAYRAKARAAHPDTGGSAESMSKLNAARDMGLSATGRKS